MKTLLVGETGTGKSYTALTISRFFRTAYIDADFEGAKPWLESEFKDLDSSDRFNVVYIKEWNDKLKRMTVKDVELVVLDSLSHLMELYKDYLQEIIKREKKYPMPQGTGIVDLEKQGIDPELIVLPMQVHSLIYDTMLNIVTNLVKSCSNVIIIMHPIETRQLTMDGKIVYSSGKLRFVQGIYRLMDCILKYHAPMTASVVKVRGIKKPSDEVNPVEFLKELWRLENGEREGG